MANQQVSNPPSAAYYLSLIGGIFWIILGIITLILFVGIWFLIAGVLLIVFAQKLMASPKEHSQYGLYILLVAIFSGNIFGIIGGILALTYQPMPTYNTAQPYQNYAPYNQPTQYASAKYCPQCGNAVGGEAQFCPKCGKKLSP